MDTSTFAQVYQTQINSLAKLREQFGAAHGDPLAYVEKNGPNKGKVLALLFPPAANIPVEAETARPYSKAMSELGFYLKRLGPKGAMTLYTQGRNDPEKTVVAYLAGPEFNGS